jgi:predicted metalloprotease
MEWENLPESSNVEERGGQGGGGLGMPISGGAGGLGIGAIIVVFAISYFTGINPAILLGGAQIIAGNGGHVAMNAPPPRSAAAPADNRYTSLVKHVLGGTEAVWAEVLPAQTGVRYTDAKLVIYSGATESGCGGARAAMGPFYCPEDKKIYLDESFFREMDTKYGGGGDFAYAYVIAHEVGHHVQDLLGTLGKAAAAEQSASRTRANAISVRVELQADCFAGVWAANADKKWKLLDDGDIQRALATAEAIGDDNLQRAARGYVVPDSFTHGSAAMRKEWLTTGLRTGRVDACDTFAQ